MHSCVCAFVVRLVVFFSLTFPRSPRSQEKPGRRGRARVTAFDRRSYLRPPPGDTMVTSPRLPCFGGLLPENVLYYGDNLEVLRQHVKDETVDLVYLDPPFNSAQD